MSSKRKYKNFFEEFFSEYSAYRGISIVTSFSLVGIFAFFSWIKLTHEIGLHPDTFEFQSEIKFDSVFVKVCGFQTKLQAQNELDDTLGQFTFSGNILGPTSGYPCPVEFQLFTNGKKQMKEAPNFNCHGCDVNSHNYNYSKNEITYSVSH